MNLRKLTQLLAFAVMLANVFTVKADNAKYVNPMIGTDGIGHTFPGATTPFGMIQLSPSNNVPQWNWCSGYHYSEKEIYGFAHNHFSGTGLSGMGDILLMPKTSSSSEMPGVLTKSFHSTFSHNNEKVSVGYYQVFLDANKVNIELTASPRVGIHKYTFTEAGEHNILIDPTYGVSHNFISSYIKVISNTEITGYKKTEDSGGRRTAYFYAKFSKPFKKDILLVNDKIENNLTEKADKNVKCIVNYSGKKNEVIEVSVALSYVDEQGAKENYEAEAKGKNFNQIHKLAKKAWDEKLNCINIDTDEDTKTIFYTALYHNFIAPNIISDVNGNYIVQGKKYNSGKLVQYSNLSFWDTYRATHPLYNLIDPKDNLTFAKVLLSRYTQAKVGLPLWEALGSDNFCMPGCPGISILSEAMLKSNRNGEMDENQVYDFIKMMSNKADRGASGNYGSDNGVRFYVKYGFIPAQSGCSVSKTTENNYYDFALAQLAKKLNKMDDYNYYMNRSLGYRNLYNEKTHFLWPRTLDGDFIAMDTTNWKDLIPNYISGNIWSYSAYTPHDMYGAIKLFGGKKAYEAWLDEIVNNNLKMKGEEHVDIAGFIGKYSHGDEPGHQFAYLYNFVGKPWKTQELAYRVMKKLYTSKVNGLPNNEDCGQMSAWYVFSAMGFYPIAPADLNFYFGTPILKRATVNLSYGKKFTMIANNLSDKAKYIQSVTLNGKEINRFYITNDEVMCGGTLVYEMGEKPNKEWASSEDAGPAYQRKLGKKEFKPMLSFNSFH